MKFDYYYDYENQEGIIILDSDKKIFLVKIGDEISDEIFEHIENLSDAEKEQEIAQIVAQNQYGQNEYLKALLQEFYSYPECFRRVPGTYDDLHASYHPLPYEE
jgi:hypothetical protein